MNFFEKDKKNSFFLTNLEIESAYKNFSELTSEEITYVSYTHLTLPKKS